VGRNPGNSQNGTRAETVITEIGPVEIEPPGSSQDALVRCLIAGQADATPGYGYSDCGPEFVECGGPPEDW